MNYKNYRFLLMLVLVLSIFISCQKTVDAPAPPVTPPVTPPVVSVDDIVKDSALFYAREIYLWYNQIPASFNPRTYADPDAIMKAIRPYSIEPGYTKPVDRWSFAITKAEWNNVTSGIAGDFGIDIFFFNSPSVTTDLRVKSVERESPAGKAGVRRGWRITKINGSTNIDAAIETSLNAVIAAVLNSASTSFTFLKPDGTSVDITLNAASYKTHPVMVDSVYSISSKKIGYLVFDAFIGDTTEIKNELDRVFNRFATEGVNEAIIDLRYNGGGYGFLAERMSDYLAPSSVSGTLMMTTKHNDKYSSWNTSRNFTKRGSVNLSRVIFIVSRGTASASEVLINNLIPVMDVKLIGRDNTHGKPVGFYGFPAGIWYVFPVATKNVNKNGDANYFNGFTPHAIVADGLDKNWGDVTETSLASAIKFITTGAFRLQADPVYRELPQITTANAKLDEHSFKGTINNRKSLK